LIQISEIFKSKEKLLLKILLNSVRAIQIKKVKDLILKDFKIILARINNLKTMYFQVIYFLILDGFEQNFSQPTNKSQPNKF
jgi:hypothetical protein